MWRLLLNLDFWKSMESLKWALKDEKSFFFGESEQGRQLIRGMEKFIVCPWLKDSIVSHIVNC